MDIDFMNMALNIAAPDLDNFNKQECKWANRQVVSSFMTSELFLCNCDQI